MKSFLKIFFSTLSVFLIVIWGSYFVFKSMEKNPVISGDSFEYYRDSFVLLSHDEVGVPILLQMDFSRKQKDGTFIHYYDGTLWYGDTQEDFSTQFHADEREVQANEYLEAYQHVPSTDLSARASYDLTVSTDLGELSFTVDTSGDFLSKNTLDYTRFSSANQATLSFAGETLPAQIVWEVAYSNDYTKSVFFEGRDVLDSTTHLFTLWDEEGNFYHIDKTAVESEQENYTSHTWVLYKEASTGSAQKGFEAELVLSEEGAQLELPEWNRVLNLTAPKNWDIENSTGLIQGTLKLADGTTKAIEGYFKNVVY